VETLPWSWYHDADVLRLEQERIFRRSWQYVGHADELAEAGDRLPAVAGQIPVVVLRDREGALRAFLNVCRHRGFQVVRERGNGKSLQCGYHAWTYDLDGALRAAPRSDREPEFDSTGLGLLPLQVDTWGPFVFVNPDAEAAPLADALGPVPELVAGLGLDVEALRFHHRSEFELEANWKLACENFLECYHCAVAHPSLSDVLDVAPDAYRLESDGLTSSQFGPLRATEEAEPFADGEVARGQFHFVWPNLTVNIFPGRANLSIGPALPVGPERTRRYLDYFFAEDVDEAWIGELLELDDQVGREDAALVEGVQRGVRSGLLEQGVLMPRSEQLIEHFQRLTRTALS
jgi:choline monooxygenase